MQNQHPRTSGSDWLSQPLVSCSPRSLSSIGYASCALPKCRSIERGGLSSDEAFRNLRLEGFQDKSTDESSHPQKRKKRKESNTYTYKNEGSAVRTARGPSSSCKSSFSEVSERFVFSLVSLFLPREHQSGVHSTLCLFQATSEIL